jgi:hypothetical protein
LSNVAYTDSLLLSLQAFDAVFFIAANEDGYYFVAGAERRHCGVINGLCYIAVSLITGHKVIRNYLFEA